MSPARLALLVASLLALLIAAPAQAAYRLSPAEKRAIASTIDRFVSSAMQRHDLAASYDLVTPTLRAGISRRAWAKGTTRVMSYPARGSHFGWTVDYALPGDVVVDLMLQPRRAAKAGPVIFTVELKKLHGRWLVDGLVPSASFVDSGRTGSMKAFGDYGPLAARNPEPRPRDRGRSRLARGLAESAPGRPAADLDHVTREHALPRRDGAPRAHIPRRDSLARPRRRLVRGGSLGVVPKQVGSSGPAWRLRAARQSAQGGTRMKLHGNAALSWSGRRRLAERVVAEGWTVTAAAEAAGVSVRCARKWVRRYRLPRGGGPCDRSSAPRRVANRTPAERAAAILALRWLRMTAAELAETLAMPPSTVSAVLPPAGLRRLNRIWLEQPVLYERAPPGELV